MSSETRVIAIAARQHGCVAGAQLASTGIDRRMVERWCAKGWLLRRHRGVYLVGPLEAPHSAAMAALLAVGPDSVLSHRSAAAVWELAAPTETIEVTVPRRGPRTRRGIAVHTTTRLPQSAVRTRHGLRVTSVERTLLDLRPADRERAAEQAHVLGLVTDHEHPAALTRSQAERRMLALIRAAGLPRPLVNTRLGPYEVDLYWPAQRLVVEVDGYAFHSSRAAFERDRLRDADLQARGLRVLRITYRRIERTHEAVVAQLAAALATAAPA